jgi:hypothetical protein
VSDAIERAAVALLTAVSIAVPATDMRPIDQPEPRSETTQHGRRLTGVASWYDYVPGGAAAGPALRSALGKDWRGTKVRVCADTDCVSVTLSDWCQCLWKQDGERIIDLDVRSFAKLAPTAQGLAKVEVQP